MYNSFQHGADVDVFADHNLSPLFLAAHRGNTECVKLLMEAAKLKGEGGCGDLCIQGVAIHCRPPQQHNLKVPQYNQTY